MRWEKGNSKELSEKFEKYLIFIQKVLLNFKISLTLMLRIFFSNMKPSKKLG